MLEIVRSGGWLMVPILLCSVAAMAICIERFRELRPQRIAPPHLLAKLWNAWKAGELGEQNLRELRQGPPLARILASGLANASHGRDVMKESIEEAASHVVHELERYLDILGTIAVITPLLGLLGTVIGMIDVFAQIMVGGSGDTTALAGGISTALVTTATGLAVAIPSVIMHRYFQRRVDELVVGMEQEAIKLVEAVQRHSGANTGQPVGEV